MPAYSALKGTYSKKGVKSNMKKAVALVVTVLMAAGIFSGCTLVQVDAEADGNRVVAVVNGEEILKKDWYSIYYMYYMYYGSSADEETLEELKDMALDSLIYQTLWEQKAKEAGFFEFTDEQRTQAREEVEKEMEEEIQANADDMKEAVEGQSGYENMDFYAEAKAAYERDMEEAGYTIDDLIESKLTEMACDNYKEELLKDIGPLEADIVEKYDELKKEQTESFTDSAKDDYVSAFNDGTIIVKNLAGYSLVQHILISFDEEDKDNVEELYKAMTDAQADVDDKQEELDESEDEDKTDLETELEELKQELEDATEAYEEAVAAAAEKIQDKTDEIYESVKDADEAKFIEIIVDKSDDTGMNTEETAKKGYLVGDEDGMIQEFHDAAVALTEEGQISEPVLGPYGYHIIRKIKDIPEGYVDLEDVRDEIKDSLTTTMKDESWSNYQDEWYNGANIKKYKNVMDV